MDEIFGEDNDLITFHMQVRYTNKSLNEKNDFQPVMEYGIFYAKNKQRFVPNKPYEEYDISKFQFAIKELGTPDETVTLGGKKVEIFKPGNYKINKVSPSIKGLKETWASGSVLKGNTSGKFFDQFLSKRKGEDGLKVLYKVYGIGEDGLGFRYFTGPQKATSIRGKFYSGIPLNKLKQIKTGEARKYKPIVNYYDFSGAVGNIRQEGGVSLNGGKKPEKMLNMLLNISTNKGDIVLDPFSGSGTTAAVCLKTGRKFVAIEQIDNQIELIKTRLVNCINGDKTGLSKAVDWQGGGNFVYTELMKKNQIFVDEINQATNEDDLNKAYQHMKKSADLDYRADLEKYENDLDRQELSFDEQKKLLLELLDKNQLYFNEANIDDADVRSLLSDTDYQFNKSFYGKGSD
jgi:adenine-specific DNA-methyltransferase